GVLLSPHSQADISRAEPGLWCLSLYENETGAEELLYIDPLSRRVKRIEIRKAGKAVIKIDYSDYRDLNGQKVPYHIRLRDQQHGSELILKYQEVKLHPELPDRLFNLPIPPGADVVDL
ncbi:MAG: DUF4292 domain-containing protein, partial [Deltaproteobacteria bacterium]|nr:DUF4292 domain-containing protein [Deltaproteobacteria bacterium]